MSKEFKDFMLSPEAGAFLQVLSTVIERAFEVAEKKEAGRHEERMEQLKISRLEAEAKADKLRAEADQIRSRSQSTSFKHHVKNA